MVAFEVKESRAEEERLMGKKFRDKDGDYEAFKWNSGKWVHVDNAFQHQKLKDGQAPVPQPFYDDNGKPISQ